MTNKNTIPVSTQISDNTDITSNRLLAEMAHATAWILFTTAQANRDLEQYGEWRLDYAQQVSMFHNDYDKALQELVEKTHFSV